MNGFADTAARRWRRLYARGERAQWPPSAAGECRTHGEGQKGTGHRMVSCPLLTPLTFLRTRLPSVARLNARDPQRRLVLQGSTLDGSGAFRSGTLPPCTVWPRTVMRGKSRKLTSGPDSFPKPARRTEPSPRNPRLAANALLSGQRKVKGVSRGDIGNRRCPTSPFAPAVGTAFPVGGHRQSPRRGHGVSAARRRQCPACPSAATHRLRRQAAGTAEPLTLC